MTNLAQNLTTTVLTNAAESAANTETVVATIAGVLTRFPGQNIVISGWVLLTPGTTTTAIQLRCRRATLGGTLVGPNQPFFGGVAPSVRGQYDFMAEDQPGEGSFTYVLTYQGTGEGTAATFQAVELIATIN